MSILHTVREKLKDVTPLHGDCGKICGARCCHSMEGEETGMLLFPGEEAAYAGQPGWKIQDTPVGKLLICPGKCRREDRPLACRLFPLMPVLRDGSIRVTVDQRAAVCPLARRGKSAMAPEFAEAVREAGELLAADAEQRAFLEKLDTEQCELKELKRKLGGGFHV